MLGTNNLTFQTIIKDKIKQMFYAFVDRAAEVRNIDTSKVSDEHLFKTINHLVGVHQIPDEIISFKNFCKEHFKEKEIIICEIGTANAGTGLFLTKSIPNVNGYIGIDLYVKNKSIFKSCFISKINFIKFFQGSSYAQATVRNVMDFLGERKIDLLFIDGDHSYEGVSKDYEIYLPLVRNGGIIAFHDIVPDYRSSRGQETGNWSGGVPLFWNKIKLLHKNFGEIIDEIIQDGKGIGYIILEE
jgi:cephalosporin hydroxylase